MPQDCHWIFWFIFIEHDCSEIVDILSEKCSLEKEDVRRKYEEFQATYPEGEITKEEFLDSMSVIPFHLKDFKVFLVDL